MWGDDANSHFAICQPWSSLFVDVFLHSCFQKRRIPSDAGKGRQSVKEGLWVYCCAEVFLNSFVPGEEATYTRAWGDRFC